jgi:glycosyltransferase involved in cell wall biosynthesis
VKVCYLTNLFPPIQTGTSYYVHYLSDAMAARGHGVLVVTCAAAGEGMTDRQEGAVRVLRLKSLGVPRFKLFLGFDEFRLAWSPRNMSRVREALRAFQPDVIQVCGHLLDLTYLAARVAARERIPAACSIHTMIHHPHKAANVLLKALDRAVHRRLAMRKFDCLLTLDKVMEEYVARVYPDVPSMPIPWGVSFDFDRYEHHPSPGPLRILSVGHVTAMRSRRGLILAARLLKDEGVPFVVRIVGKVLTQKPVRLVQQLGLQDHVIFVGERPREQVLAELCECDVHAMWITNPGVGTTGMEAMCVGVPVMMWAAEDQLGFLRTRHMEDAVLIDPEQPEGIAAALRRLSTDPALRERIGRNARALAREHFSWPRIAVRMEDVYQQVIETAKKRA